MARRGICRRQASRRTERCGAWLRERLSPHSDAMRAPPARLAWQRRAVCAARCCLSGRKEGPNGPTCHRGHCQRGQGDAPVWNCHPICPPPSRAPGGGAPRTARVWHLSALAYTSAARPAVNHHARCLLACCPALCQRPRAPTTSVAATHQPGTSHRLGVGAHRGTLHQTEQRHETLVGVSLSNVFVHLALEGLRLEGRGRGGVRMCSQYLYK